MAQPDLAPSLPKALERAHDYAKEDLVPTQELLELRAYWKE